MILTMRNVEKSFVSQGVRKEILRGVSLSLDAGQSVALTGESGSGKSTLLHLAAALDHCDKGEISLLGRDITHQSESERAALRRSDVAVIFQQFNLISSLNVWQNITLHARMAARFDESWATELSDRLGLTELHKRFPDQLSGGQQQRVAIARAMTLRPPLLLADEPTGNLDENSSVNVMDALLDLTSQQNTALLLVTHSADVAGRTMHRLHLSGGRIS